MKCSICGRSIKRINIPNNPYPKPIEPLHEKLIVKERQEIVCENCLKKMKFCK